MTYVAKYFALIPPELLPDSYIVSGAAMDAMMNMNLAKDVDIVILKAHTEGDESWSDFEERILGRLRDHNPDRVIKEVLSKDGKYNGIIRRHLCNILGYYHRLSTIEDKRVEILLSDAGNIKQVLAGFDLSIHQIAFRSNFTFTKGDAWTPMHQPIQVTDWNNPCHTLDRYLRLCKRYDQVYDQKVVDQLMAHIHEAKQEEVF